MADTLKIEGFEDMTAQLSKLEAWAYKDVLKNACQKAAKIVADEAKNLAPEKTGRLKRAIRVRVGRARDKGSVSYLASCGKQWFKGDEYYGAFQEFGFKHGSRKGSGASFSTKHGKGRSDSRKQVEGYHFMEYAFNEKGQEALDELMRAMKEGIEEELGNKT